MSRWMPNTLSATATVLSGVSSTVIVEKDMGVAHGKGRFKVLIDIRPVQLPGNQTFYRTRYYGPVGVEFNEGSGTGIQTATHIYDLAIDKAISSGVAEADVLTQISTSLTGRVFTMTRIGGRWIIQ